MQPRLSTWRDSSPFGALIPDAQGECAMTYLRHDRSATRALHLLAAAILLGQLSPAAGAQAGPTPESLAPAGGGEFALPLRVIGSKDIEAAPGVIPGDILELRVGRGPDSSSFTAVAAVRSTSPNLTLMLLNGRRATTPAPPGGLEIDAITIRAVENIQGFSLGGGCPAGNSTVFTYVRNQSNNFRPYALWVTNGVPTVTPLNIAGTDQIHSIECAGDPNGQDVYYLAANATQARVEVWKGTGTAQPTNLSVNLPQLLSPFNGGIRPIMASIEMNVVGAAIAIQYQRSNGQITVSYYALNPFNLAATCLLFTQSPVPNTFTVVREGRIISLRGGSALTNYFGSVADLDRNGSAELVTTPTSSCAPVLTGKGSSAGGNGFNWTGYGAIGNPARNWGYVGNGNSLLRVDYPTGATQSLAVPLIGPGGPFDFMGGRVADSKAYGFFALGTRPGFPREIRAVLLGESLGQANFASGFEGPSLDTWYVYNQSR